LIEAGNGGESGRQAMTSDTAPGAPAPATETETETESIPPTAVRQRMLRFADQELRLISALVVLLALGLFLALPFVLSIGSVVFLPLVSAMILTIVLSPLADRLARAGSPPMLSAFLSLLSFLAVLALALTVVLRPAVALFDQAPAMIRRIGEHFHHLQGSVAWATRLNDQIAAIAGARHRPEVVLAEPSVVQQLAFATPSVVLELLLTFLMTFFMIEARLRARRRMQHTVHMVGPSLRAAKVMRDVQDRVAAYITTVGLINLGVGLIVATGAVLLGVDAPIMWGGLAALLNFLPYVGPFSMIGLLALFGLGTAEAPLVGLIPAAAYFGLHAVESNFVTPAIIGARFTMNPVLILLALSYFSWIWGFTGALLSVPILLTVTAMIDHLGRPNLIGFLFGEPLFSPPEAPAPSPASNT
jgi:predicted PurR-regulated permease PerM